MRLNINDITDPVKRARVMRMVNESLADARTGENPIAAASDSATRDRVCLSVSTDEEKLNKTERAFLAWLRASHTQWIGIQAITLKLGHDCRYTPDFASTDLYGLVFWEVKGFWRDDARVKIKVAARMYPWARFSAVQRVKGAWKFETIKP